jgi:murein tripeptide amidase MpaA
LIKEFTENDPETVKIFAKYQIHIMPLVNADGSEYSHTNTRLWRKNRKASQFSSCIGVDLNRNWGYKWMVS